MISIIVIFMLLGYVLVLFMITSVVHFVLIASIHFMISIHALFAPSK